MRGPPRRRGDYACVVGGDFHRQCGKSGASIRERSRFSQTPLRFARCDRFSVYPWTRHELACGNHRTTCEPRSVGIPRGWARCDRTDRLGGDGPRCARRARRRSRTFVVDPKSKRRRLARRDERSIGSPLADEPRRARLVDGRSNLGSGRLPPRDRRRGRLALEDRGRNDSTREESLHRARYDADRLAVGRRNAFVAGTDRFQRPGSQVGRPDEAPPHPRGCPLDPRSDAPHRGVELWQYLRPWPAASPTDPADRAGSGRAGRRNRDHLDRAVV